MPVGQPNLTTNSLLASRKLYFLHWLRLPCVADSTKVNFSVWFRLHGKFQGRRYRIAGFRVNSISLKAVRSPFLTRPHIHFPGGVLPTFYSSFCLFYPVICLFSRRNVDDKGDDGGDGDGWSSLFHLLHNLPLFYFLVWAWHPFSSERVVRFLQAYIYIMRLLYWARGDDGLAIAWSK